MVLKGLWFNYYKTILRAGFRTSAALGPFKYAAPTPGKKIISDSMSSIDVVFNISDSKVERRCNFTLLNAETTALLYNLLKTRKLISCY
ncbi:hypothetical protein QTP88_024089 [Uroleucon formosanum]